MEKVMAIFNEAQQFKVNHKAYALRLNDIIDEQNVVYKIKDCILILLKNKMGNHVYVENGIAFVAVFCQVLKDVSVFEDIVSFLLKYCSSSIESERYWACKAISAILQQFADADGDLDEEVCSKASEILIARLNETKCVIRKEAILALEVLQIHEDIDDPVRNAFLAYINCDGSAKIRDLLVQKVAINRNVIPYLLNSIRDIDFNVRLSAYKRFAEIIKFCRISQKQEILRYILRDPDDGIKLYAKTTFLPNLLNQYEGNYLEVMKALRFDSNEEDIEKFALLCEKILNIYLSSATLDSINQYIKLNEEKCIPFQDLTWENILFYRITLDFFHSSPVYDQVLIEKAPDLVVLCKYIKNFFLTRKNDLPELFFNFILQQLLLITARYNVSDTYSRHNLTALLQFLLLNGSTLDSVTAVIVRNLEKCIPALSARSLFVHETITNIMEGVVDVDYASELEKKIKHEQTISQLSADLQELKVLEEEYIEKRQFRDLEECVLKQKNLQKELHSVSVIDKFQSPKIPDDATYLKVFNVMIAFLKSVKTNEATESLKLFNKTITAQCLKSFNVLIKTKAFEAYCLMCVIDYETAKYGIHLFAALVFGESDVPESLLTVGIAGVSDLLMIYGLNLVEETIPDHDSNSDSEEIPPVFVGGTALSSILQSLSNLLDHEDAKVQKTATVAVLKFLQIGVISAPLFAAMLLKWVDPQIDLKLKLFIGHAVESLGKLPKVSSYCVDAFIMVLKKINEAPSYSPLVKADLDEFCKFIAAFCAMSLKNSLIVDGIIQKSVKIMRANPKSALTRILIRLLLMLPPPADDSSQIMLTELCDFLELNIKLKTVLKEVQKLKNKTPNANFVKEEQESCD